MKSAILEKLKILLSNPINEEAKAVYIMAQLRKIWEEEGKPKTPLCLWMHWALHVKLEGYDSTFELLNEIDQVVDDLCNNGPVIGPERLAFHTFRKDLKDCLLRFGLPTKICDEDVLWSIFITAYSSVIEDGELTLNTTHLSALKYVTEVKFTKGRAMPMGDFPFTLNWKVSLKNCKFKEINVRPMPNEALHGFTGWSYETVNI